MCSCFIFVFPGYQKYFATPSGVREGKANENYRCSALESAIDVVSLRKKSLTPACTSTGTMKVGGVTLREHGRPLTRSKGVILSCYLDSHVVTLERNCVCTETVKLTYWCSLSRLQESTHADGLIRMW
jgi:hypothetical protein